MPTKRTNKIEQALLATPILSSTIKNQIIKENVETLRSHIINNDLATAIQGHLITELKSKLALRRWLIISISLYFVFVTIAILAIAIFLAQVVAVKVQSYLITGLFSNLIGLLVIIYRYAFADTSKLIHELATLTK
ncbi:hypothetical protein [Fructobacillus ficulneus]|uniref:Uncharacterized protein n=1 Tax=Fructobacillus ficulneus TaxID=157463 RepID=A0A0K8MHM8_9LACO|nr:hypothetical protein [Fructobacillus ficulneus]GAP00056.1 hypothetical protein FFIC_280610 [Fructobacillus ficulneus]